jgi:hypothetical protein
MERLPSLAGWDNFYVIVGSSAAALTGLQFVVITLVNDRDDISSTDTIGAFGTPTIVHFCATLLVAATVCAPWTGMWGPRIALMVVGLAGLVYVGAIIRRTRRQRHYQPVFEDWLFHAILPAVAYVSLFSAAVATGLDPRDALFAVAAAAVLLLFIGIHNAWDAVTYIAVARREEQNRK